MAQTETLHKAEDAAARQGWKVLDSEDFPGDGIIAPHSITLCETRGTQPFATHFFNRQDGGFCNGHYHDKIGEARQDFRHRVAKGR